MVTLTSTSTTTTTTNTDGKVAGVIRIQVRHYHTLSTTMTSELKVYLFISIYNIKYNKKRFNYEIRLDYVVVYVSDVLIRCAMHGCDNYHLYQLIYNSDVMFT